MENLLCSVWIGTAVDELHLHNSLESIRSQQLSAHPAGTRCFKWSLYFNCCNCDELPINAHCNESIQKTHAMQFKKLCNGNWIAKKVLRAVTRSQFTPELHLFWYEYVAIRVNDTIK